MTQEQEAVCESNADRVRVLAGGGTGKTHTMAELARRNPEGCLVLAYTVAAAREFYSRIMNPLVEVRTVHSLALEILRVFPGIEIPEINHEEAIDELAGDCLVDAGVPNSSSNRKILVKGLDFLLAREFSLEGFASSSSTLAAAKLPRLTESLYSQMVANGLATFNMWVYLAVLLLENNPDFLKAQSQRWQTVIVDEAQDLTPLLAHLIRLLTGGSRLVIVGDPCQEIFGYSGAGIPWFTDPGWEEYHLTTCFRSAPEILEVVNRARTDGLTVSAANPRLAGRVGRHSYDPGNKDWDRLFADNICSSREAGTVAVLAPTHAELRRAGKILDAAGILYRQNNPDDEPDFTAPASRTTKGGTVILSTIHSAKGMEWDSVHAIAMGSLVHPSVLTGFQERNLQHVAVSRPKTRLYMYFWEGGENV